MDRRLKENSFHISEVSNCTSDENALTAKLDEYNEKVAGGHSSKSRSRSKGTLICPRIKKVILKIDGSKKTNYTRQNSRYINLGNSGLSNLEIKRGSLSPENQAESYNKCSLHYQKKKTNTRVQNPLHHNHLEANSADKIIMNLSNTNSNSNVVNPNHLNFYGGGNVVTKVHNNQAVTS